MYAWVILNSASVPQPICKSLYQLLGQHAKGEEPQETAATFLTVNLQDTEL